MSNEEFDNLKEELMWEGSSVVMLSMSIFLLFFISRIELIKILCHQVVNQCSMYMIVLSYIRLRHC